MAVLGIHQRVNLERRGLRWYVVKDIPPSLRKIAGKKRLLRSTRTGDLATANARKPAILATFQREMDGYKRALTDKADPLMEKARWLGEYAREHPEDMDDDERMGISVREAAELNADGAPDACDRGPTAAHIYRVGLGDVPLTDALVEFLEAKPIAAKTRLDYSRAIKNFLAWSGLVFPQDLTVPKAYQYVGQLKQRFSKCETLNREITALSSFWRWLAKKGTVAQNPWHDQRPERDHRGSDKEHWRTFSVNEMLAILAHMPEGTVLGDFARIGALSGMRAAEIAELCTVREVSGVICFSIARQEGKTVNAPRDIPVHSELVDIVARRGAADKSLFGDVEAKHTGDALGKRFSRVTRKELGITDKLKVFHSLRKWHATELERSDVPPWAMETIQGRSRIGLGLSRYSDGHTMARLQEFVDGVHLPTAAGVKP